MPLSRVIQSPVLFFGFFVSAEFGIKHSYLLISTTTIAMVAKSITITLANAPNKMIVLFESESEVDVSTSPEVTVEVGNIKVVISPLVTSAVVTLAVVTGEVVTSELIVGEVVTGALVIGEVVRGEVVRSEVVSADVVI